MILKKIGFLIISAYLFCLSLPCFVAFYFAVNKTYRMLINNDLIDSFLMSIIIATISAIILSLGLFVLFISLTFFNKALLENIKITKINLELK